MRERHAQGGTGSEPGMRLDEAFADSELDQSGGRIDVQMFHHAVLVKGDRAG